MKLLIGKIKNLDKIHMIKIKGRFGKAVTGAKSLKQNIPISQKLEKLAKEMKKVSIAKHRALYTRTAKFKDGVNLEQRAKEIHSALDEFSQSKRTTAVARVKNVDGTEQILVGSSEKRISRAQRELLNPGEVEAIGEGHAEVTIINQAKANNQKVIDIAASRPICPNCANAIKEAGANPVSPLKQIKG